MIVNRKEAVGAGGWSIVNGNKRSIQSYFMARTRIKDEGMDIDDMARK